MKQQIVQKINSPEIGQQIKHQTTTIGKTHLLQQYIYCLQKQNHTKNIQRQTLYTQLQRLQNYIHSLEQQRTHAKSQPSSLESTQLLHRIRDLEQQVTILKYQQQHLFEENLSLISTLQQALQKVQEVERQNKELKRHKEQLDRFRVALEKITKNLELIQVQRVGLERDNLVLVEENSYLKRVLAERNECGGNKQQQQSMKKQQDTHLCLRVNEANSPKDYQHSLPQITSVSNYFMSSSFEKISQYQEEYEQSNGKSVSRNDTGSRYNSSKREEDNMDEPSENKQVQEWDEENQLPDQQKNQQERSMRSIKNAEHNQAQRDEQNQSSYLIFDQRSGQSFSLSFQVHQAQRGSNKPIVVNKSSENQEKIHKQLEEDENEQLICREYEKNQDKYDEQSSNDVIQQINDQPSLSSLNHQAHSKTHNGKKSSQDIQQALKRQIITLKQQLQLSQTQRHSVQKKIKQIQKTQEKNISEMQSKIQELLNNYESIVNYTQELEQDNVELYKRNEMMERQTQFIGEDKQQIEKGVRQLLNEKNMLVEERDQLMGGNQQLEQENQQLKQQVEQMKLFCTQAQQYINSLNFNHIQQHNSLTNYPSEIDHFQLIKQNNQLIERVNQLEIENSSLYYKINSGYSNQSSRKWFDQQNDKENCVNYLNHTHNHLNLLNNNNKFFKTHQHEYVQQPNPKNTSLSFRSQINKQQSVKRRNSLQQANNINLSGYSLTDKRKPMEDPRDSLKQKLQKRIQSIKQQNLQLLNELEYY